MPREQFIDVIQTTGILVIAVALIVTAVRFIRAVDLGAQRVKEALTMQREIHATLDRVWKRVEALERVVWERNEILPNSQLATWLDEVKARLDRLETHERTGGLGDS
jgi:hypothetical protein